MFRVNIHFVIIITISLLIYCRFGTHTMCLVSLLQQQLFYSRVKFPYHRNTGWDFPFLYAIVHFGHLSKYEICLLTT